MIKEDAHRIRKFLGILMRCDYGSISGKDMVTLVNDMTWLAKEADALEKPALTILNQKSLDKPQKGKKGKKK